LSRRAPVRSRRIEAFEYQAAVVTKQFMHTDHPQEEDGIIVIALDPFTFASWTLHPVHSSRVRELVVRGIAPKALDAQLI